MNVRGDTALSFTVAEAGAIEEAEVWQQPLQTPLSRGVRFAMAVIIIFLSLKAPERGTASVHVEQTTYPRETPRITRVHFTDTRVADIEGKALIRDRAAPDGLVLKELQPFTRVKIAGFTPNGWYMVWAGRRWGYIRADLVEDHPNLPFERHREGRDPVLTVDLMVAKSQAGVTDSEIVPIPDWSSPKIPTPVTRDRVAYVATNDRNSYEISDTLVGLARRVESQQQQRRSQVPAIDIIIVGLSALFVLTIYTFIAVCFALPSTKPTRQGRKSNTQEKKEMTDNNEKSMTKFSGNAFGALRSELDRLRRDLPALRLPPVPKHSHDFEGWINEWFKRRDLGSHTKTEAAQTELIRQQNQFCDQVLALAHKHLQFQEFQIMGPLQSLVKLEKFLREQERDFQADQLDLDRLRRAAEREKEEHRLAVIKTRGEGLRVRKETELRAIQADQEIEDLLFPRVKESEHTRREGQLKREIDRIVAEVDSVVELTQQCSEIEKRYPEAHRPLIKRLFRKAIDRRMEAL